MAVTVFDEIESRMDSVYSIHKYLAYPVKWDKLIKDILNLKAKGVHALQVAGRFDIASYKLYNDPMLDWILMVYNGIKKIGNSEGTVVNKTINLTLEAGEDILFDIPLQHANLEIIYNGETVNKFLDIEERTYADLDSDRDKDIQITYYSHGAARIENVSSSTEFTFQISYTETEYDKYLDQGTEILYPAKLDVDNLLNEINEIEDRITTGFSRL